MSKAKIQIVEDEVIVAKDLRARLQGFGYAIVGVASTGEDAIRLAEAESPDLILMDITLKGDLDGIETAERIHESADIPVIFVTAHADETTLHRAKVTDPSGYILKPFEDRELHTTVEMALYKSITDRKIRESERWLNTTLRSIADGVITTDWDDRITFMNPVAEHLTGWMQAEALGHDLVEVYTIIEESTGRKIESPSSQLTREGVQGESVVQCLLRSRNNTQTFIEHSAAPLRDAKGAIAGVVLVFRDVTLQRKAERVARAGEEYFRSLIENANDVITILNHDGTTRYESPAIKRVLGYQPEELVGKIPFAYIHPDDRERAVAIFRESLAYPDRSLSIELRFIAADGKYHLLDMHLRNLLRDPAVKGIVVNSRDITERRLVDEDRRLLAERLQSVIETVEDGITFSDGTGHFLIFNSKMTELTGYTIEEANGSGDFTSMLYPDPAHRQKALDGLADLLAHGHSHEVDTVITTKSGTPRHMLVSSKVIQQGNETMFLSSYHDMSERMRVMERLRASESKYRALIEMAPDLVYLVDAEEKILILNPLAAKTLGGTVDDITGKRQSDVFPADIIEEHSNAIRAVFATGQPWFAERQVEFPVGHLWIEARLIPVGEADGHPASVMGFLRDISDRKRQDEQVRKLSRAVEQSPSSIVITDTKGVIEYVNPRFSEVTGYTREEAIGQNPRIQKSGHRAKKDYEQLWTTILAGQEWRGEFQNRKKDGSLYWEAASISPIRNSKGVITHFLAVKEDITERKRTEEELRQHAEDLYEAKLKAEEQTRLLEQQAVKLRLAQEEALQASRFKSEFVANMSHEIRTPMNGIIGMTGLLLDSTLTSEQRDYAEIVRTSGDALLTIINDILDFSKIEAGKMSLEVIDFNPRTVAEEVVDLLGRQAAQKNLELTCCIHDHMPPALKGDPGRLRQVIMNLLSNAIKFTASGEVGIRLTSPAANANHVVLRCEVQDTGIGIDDEARRRLFTAFQQADGSTTRKYGGTGLGLAISRQIVELMGGKIGVDSLLGTGSTFWFEVPLPIGTATLEVDHDDSDLKDIHVLVVDDNLTSRTIIARQLDRHSLRHTSVGSPSEALDELRNATAAGDPYDIALLDLQMPEMDGLTLSESIATDPAIMRPRMVLLSSLGIRSEEQKNAGDVNAWLVKPVKESQLFETIRSAVQKNGRNAAHEAAATPGNGKSAHDTVIRVLVVEDNAVNQKVARRMLERLGARVDVVGNGREAVEATANLPYDLLLMDCQMPEMDGFEATAAIRERERGVGHTPIVAMTANAFQGDREKCINAGMDDYIAKPVRQTDIEEIITRWAKRNIERSMPSPAAAATPAKTPIPVLDHTRLEDLRSLDESGSDEFLQMLIQRYIEDANGRVAGIRIAVETGSSRTLEELAHALKGSSGNLGVTAVEATARSLQSLGHQGNIDAAVPLVDRLERDYAEAREALTHLAVPHEVAR